MNSNWNLLVIHLAAKQKTLRMRIWRKLKAYGAESLRDGVYMLPGKPECRAWFDELSDQVNDSGGNASVLACTARDDEQQRQFMALFDRTSDYESWIEQCDEAAGRVSDTGSEASARKIENTLRKSLDSLRRSDFFPGRASRLALERMDEIARQVNQAFSPGEPVAENREIVPRKFADYQNRIWATRKDLWVDRVASAWLIQHFIDPGATFAWLESPASCPRDAVGFDFDNAEFTHIGPYCSFEVLLHSFGLGSDAALEKIGRLVRYLDIGGTVVADASGILTLLGAMRRSCPRDDEFLQRAGTLFDDLRNGYADK